MPQSGLISINKGYEGVPSAPPVRGVDYVSGHVVSMCREAAVAGTTFPISWRSSDHPPRSQPWQLLRLEAKVADAQARGVVAHVRLDILREAVDGLGGYIEHQRDRRTARSVQLA